MIAIATRGVLYHSSVVTPLPASPSSPASSSSSSVSDSLSTSSRPSSSSSPSGVMGGAAVAGRDHAFNSFASHPTNRHRSDQIRSGKAGQGEVQLVVGGRGQGGAAWRTSEEMSAEAPSADSGLVCNDTSSIKGTTRPTLRSPSPAAATTIAPPPLLPSPPSVVPTLLAAAPCCLPTMAVSTSQMQSLQSQPETHSTAQCQHAVQPQGVDLSERDLGKWP